MERKKLTYEQQSNLIAASAVKYDVTVSGLLKQSNGHSRWNQQNQCTWIKFKDSEMNRSIKRYTGKKLSEWFEGKNKYSDAGRLSDLLDSMDNANCIAVVDRHLKTLVQVSSKQQLYTMLGLSSRSQGLAFCKRLIDANILKEVKIEIMGEKKRVSRYYINPVLTMDKYGIHPETWRVFREALIPYLWEDTVQLLDHVNYIYYSQNLSEDGSNDEILAITEENVASTYIPEAPSYDVFARTVLAGNEPQCYDSDNWGMAHEPESNENVFFLVQESNGRRKAEDIVAYRNVAIDIDFGRDSNGEYIKDIDIIDERKMIVWQQLRPVLPTPTAVVESRNGFHMYWSIEKTEEKVEWECLAAYIKSVLAGIIDPTVTTDAARVLRVPGSIHHKEGLMAFDVSLTETNDIIYDTAELTSAFCSAKEAIKGAKEVILEQIPDMQSATNSSVFKTASATNPSAFVSARIEAIRNLSLDTFEAAAEPIEMAYKDNNEYLRHLDMGEFLQLPAGGSIRCILHENKPGHQSATIYAPDDRADNWRYICHCQDKPLDIVGIVMALADCTSAQAYQYLNRIYGISIKKVA